MWALFPTTRAWGALLPYTPSGDGGERVHTLSRSPGTGLAGSWFPTMQSCSFDGIRFRRCGNCSLEVFRSRRRGRGALCSPTSPRVTGCERVITLSRSPGVRLAGSLVSDGAGNCSGLEDLISDGAELFGRGFWFPTERGTVLIGGFDFQRSGGLFF